MDRTLPLLWVRVIGVDTNEEPDVFEISKFEGGVTVIFPDSPYPLTINDCSAEGPDTLV